MRLSRNRPHMPDGLGLETYANHGSTTGAQPEHVIDVPPDVAREKAMRRALVFMAIAAASAGLAFAIVRATLVRPPADPTTERIQQLIDEANRLLKQLDEKRSD